MNKTAASIDFITRMNAEAERLRALAVAFDEAVAQFGVQNLATCLQTPQQTTA
jgi:hypothetical protein